MRVVMPVPNLDHLNKYLIENFRKVCNSFSAINPCLTNFLTINFISLIKVSVFKLIVQNRTNCERNTPYELPHGILPSRCG